MALNWNNNLTKNIILHTIVVGWLLEIINFQRENKKKTKLRSKNTLQVFLTCFERVSHLWGKINYFYSKKENAFSQQKKSERMARGVSTNYVMRIHHHDEFKSFESLFSSKREKKGFWQSFFIFLPPDAEETSWFYYYATCEQPHKASIKNNEVLKQ